MNSFRRTFRNVGIDWGMISIYDDETYLDIDCIGKGENGGWYRAIIPWDKNTKMTETSMGATGNYYHDGQSLRPRIAHLFHKLPEDIVNRLKEAYGIN